jgi:2-keto-4-pentenoate hydratase
MEAQLAERDRRLATGESALGWKVGFGSAKAMKPLAIAAPLIGFLTDRSPLQPGAEALVGDWARPVLEPEIAVRVGTDLAPGGGLEAAAEAIGAIGPAYELVDVDPPPNDVAAILAGNIFHRHVVFDPQAEVEPERFGTLRASIVRNGDERRVSDPQAATGEIVGVVRHVADLLGAFAQSLRAGELVICGSIIPPISVAPGDLVAYRLDPVGAITLRLG